VGFVLLLGLVSLAGEIAGAANAPAATGKPGAEAGPPGQGQGPSQGDVAEDSPRAALTDFLELCARERYAEAARYLDLPASRRSEGPALARQLESVLDHLSSFDPERVSALPQGVEGDGLPPLTDEVAAVPGQTGLPEPVRMVRRAVDGQPRWMFGQATVNRIDDWYDSIEESWVRRHLPEPLLRRGPRRLAWWQWLALPLLCLIAWPIGRALGGLTRAVAHRLLDSAHTPWAVALRGVRAPVTLGWSLVIIWAELALVDLHAPAERFAGQCLRAGTLIAFFWTLLRFVNLMRGVVQESSWIQHRPAVRGFLPLGMRIAQVSLILIAAITALSELGFSVTSLIAGLGIGGLAVALAAQKTVENLFGSLSISVDQPFRVGDFVKVEDTMGTVESIGLRSTRVRTPDRTLVTYPNGKLSDLRVENFAVRDRSRFGCTLGLAYGTTSAQLREVLAGCEACLRAQHKLRPEGVTVRFKGIGAASLDVEIGAYFETSDGDEFMRIREEVLLGFMDVVERAGTSFASPSQTIQVVTESSGPEHHVDGGRGRPPQAS
jgi:MscS family membrane protein